VGYLAKLASNGRTKMDGKRIQSYWSQEVQALLETYRQFEILIPSNDHEGSAHHGEDGRFTEDLIREYLSRYLPKGLEVLTGFILRPAVKTGRNGNERKKDSDEHSTQLDIIVFDSEHYPIFQRFGNSVIVPPEGVVAVFSVKKYLNEADVVKECQALRSASKLCRTINNSGKKVRGPYLGLVCVKSKINKKTSTNEEWIFNQIQKAYSGSDKPTFDDLIGFIGDLSKWSIFKRRPSGSPATKSRYVYLEHSSVELHFGLQFMLTGVLSVYYDETRANTRRPGFTAFPSNYGHARALGEINCDGER
jgi:hypothetical protein